MSMSGEVLLVNLGTPRAPTPEGVREFLQEFLSDPMVIDYPKWFWQPILRGMVLRRRPERVAELYRSIWHENGSPLRVGTERMVERLATLVDSGCRVRSAYRYGAPSIGVRIERALGRKAEKVLVIPLFPQRSGTTSGTIDCRAREVAREAGSEDRLEVLEILPDDPGYIDGIAARFEEAVSDGATDEHLVITFHGVPKRYDRKEGGRYHSDCTRTAETLLRRLGRGWDGATLAYQSRFGPEPWLGPATDAVLKDLPRRGVLTVTVVAPGFLTDGLETLEELGVRGREAFLQAGGERLTLVPAVCDEEQFLQSLARRVEGRLA